MLDFKQINVKFTFCFSNRIINSNITHLSNVPSILGKSARASICSGVQ